MHTFSNINQSEGENMDVDTNENNLDTEQDISYCLRSLIMVKYLQQDASKVLYRASLLSQSPLYKHATYF